MSNRESSIPLPVKRQLRQESGFGCCFCGHPFLEYHHIIPYAEEAHNRPEDMMAVCGNCHHLCTTEAVAVKEQRAAKAKPKNPMDGFMDGLLFTTSADLIVKLGPTTIINTPNILQNDDEGTVLGIKKSPEGRVLVSAIIHDAAGTPIARLNDNEWSVDTKQVWDFEAYTKRAIIRCAPRDVAFSIDCRDDEIDITGKWNFYGNKISFSRNNYQFGTITGSGQTTISNCGVAFSVAK